MGSSDELNLDAPWSIGETAFRAIIEDARDLHPRVIHEFGSGISSIRLAMAFPAAHITTIDHDEHFAGRTRALAHRHGISDRVTVFVEPLTWHFRDLGPFRSYERTRLSEPTDLVLIDGPPSTAFRGREYVMLESVSTLRPGGRLYLDDAERFEEAVAASRCQASWPRELATRYLALGHGIMVLEKRTAPLAAPMNRVPVLASVLESGSRWAASRAKEALYRHGGRLFKEWLAANSERSKPKFGINDQ